jgi:hypothetical protein
MSAKPPIQLQYFHSHHDIGYNILGTKYSFYRRTLLGSWQVSKKRYSYTELYRVFHILPLDKEYKLGVIRFITHNFENLSEKSIKDNQDLYRTDANLKSIKNKTKKMSWVAHEGE